MKVKALKVRQWLAKWDEVSFDPKIHQSKPQDHFYVCSMKASHLKALTGVYRRSTTERKPRVLDPNVQRGHDEERSQTIRQFVQFGYPWCEMGEAKRNLPGADDLLKPGWLPTAILVNILQAGAIRNGVKIPEADLISVEMSGDAVALELPKGFRGSNWEPQQVYPLEVIDGQHRLWAFDGYDPGADFELPVVAFYGLDHGWQAYLFWSVNITPKRINRSLAFDLYPLLRQQSWLDKFAGHSIYRETRCQELVETLWSHPASPWHQRINMLGERLADREYQGPSVSQAAWVRSLMASFVKQWEGSGTRIGGLFGAPASADEPLLPWSRPMQAAVLLSMGTALKEAVARTPAKWATHLRSLEQPDLLGDDDPAFYGGHSLISTDQGIRGLLFIMNDLCFVESEHLGLSDWTWESVNAELSRRRAAATDEALVSAALKSFEKTPAASFVADIAGRLARHDWRTSATPGLNDDERVQQAVFRGSSGYKEMRRRLLDHLSSGSGAVARGAKAVKSVLGYP